MKYTTPTTQEQNARQVHPAHRQDHVRPVNAQLFVITAITNPHRYRSRYTLYRAFEKMVEEAGAILYTVEVALRDRHHEITSPTNPHHIQLRSPEIIWHKENAQNIALRHVMRDHPEAEYFAFVDADVQFTRTDWVTETIHQLQIYRVVQMWSVSIDLGPDSEHNATAFQQPIAQCQSLIYSYQQDRRILHPIDRKAMQAGNGAGNAQKTGRGKGIFVDPKKDCYEAPAPKPGLLHTGYAWAWRRAALVDVGGLGDIGVLGSGDRHMAYALLGEVDRSMHAKLHDTYKAYWRQWQQRAEESIRRKVGVVPGTLLHHWHGSKQRRRYQDRWKILIDNNFDWTRDVKKDIQGLWMLQENKWQFRDDLIDYFSQRNEDENTI